MNGERDLVRNHVRKRSQEATIERAFPQAAGDANDVYGVHAQRVGNRSRDGSDTLWAVNDTRRRFLIGTTAILACLTIAGLVVLWPADQSLPSLAALGVTSDVYEAEVFEAYIGPCAGTESGAGIDCYKVGFELKEGPDASDIVVLDFPFLASSPTFAAGDQVVMNRLPEAAPGFEYQYADRQRRSLLGLIAVGFALSVIALGRFKGVAALAGLAASVVVLLLFIVPSLLANNPPVMVAVVGSAAIAFVALYTAHGFNPPTTVALLGTLAALLLTAGLSALAVAAAELSGFTSEESLLLTMLPGRIDARGLILAGIVIGSLGALDDVTVTQVSAVTEIRKADPTMPRPALLRAGLRVGRDHIASTVNTLFLAYAGASMPLLVLFALSNQSLGTIANSEVVATEIIRTLLGSIGLVAAVPITTWLATLLDPSEAVRRQK